MVLHLTQFCSWLFPFLGLVVPLIMWQSKKEDPYVDEQGKVVMNWVFSSLIYAIRLFDTLCGADWHPHAGGTGDLFGGVHYYGRDGCE